MTWQLGRHHPVHVYDGDRPVATFFREEDARRCVRALDYLEEVRAYCHEVDDNGEVGLVDSGPTVAVHVLELLQEVDRGDP